MKKRTTAEFRQHLETVTAEARASASNEVADLVEYLIDFLCKAHERDGLAESRRGLDRFMALIEQEEEAGGEGNATGRTRSTRASNLYSKTMRPA